MAKSRSLLVLLTALSAALLSGICAAPGWCYLSGRFDLSSAIAQSSVVVVATIAEVREGEPCLRQAYGGTRWDKPQPALLQRAVARVEVLVKGEGLAAGDTVRFQFLSADARSHFLPPSTLLYKEGERWLLFLHRHEGCLEPMNPLGEQDLRIPAEARLEQQTHSLPLHRAEAVLAKLLLGSESHEFVRELLSRLRYGTGMVVMPVGNPPLHESIPWRYQHCFASYQLLNAVDNLCHSPDQAIRAEAAAIMCRVGSVEALDRLVAAVRSRSEWLKSECSPRLYLDAIRGVTDVRALPKLHDLLLDPDAAFHAPAAHALRQIGDAASVPYLVKALDDSEFEVRYLAATGLAQIAGDHERYVAADVFRRRGAELIGYWKARHAGGQGESGGDAGDR
jgi:hypothetical protein